MSLPHRRHENQSSFQTALVQGIERRLSLSTHQRRWYAHALLIETEAPVHGELLSMFIVLVLVHIFHCIRIVVFVAMYPKCICVVAQCTFLSVVQVCNCELGRSKFAMCILPCISNTHLTVTTFFIDYLNFAALLAAMCILGFVLQG